MTARLIAIVLMIFAGAASAAELGRMFYTPAQRATLDNARKQNIRVDIGNDSEQAAPVPQNMSVNGVVRRSDGKNTVWMNNRIVADRNVAGVGVVPSRNDNRVKLTVPDSGRSVDLKVGQTIEIVSGRIEESYARRVAPNPETPSADKPVAAGADASKAQTPAATPRRRARDDPFEPAPAAPVEPAPPAAAAPAANPARLLIRGPWSNVWIAGACSSRPREPAWQALILLLVLVGLVTGMFVFNAVSGVSLTTARNDIDARALAQAKQALIGYAVSDANWPGSLPCPDTLIMTAPLTYFRVTSAKTMLRAAMFTSDDCHGARSACLICVTVAVNVYGMPYHGISPRTLRACPIAR